ncbi:MAG: hypothetical protein U1A27_04250 [Phycisphaerae bacterium]
MTAVDTVLHAHSVAEIGLYFILTPCPSCGRFALRPRGLPGPPDESHVAHWLTAGCAACLRDYPSVFLIEPAPVVEPAGAPLPPVINPTFAPSRLIDLLGWIILYRHYVEQTAQPVDARRMTLVAAQCLDEALKFYPRGAAAPPVEAFFSARSRERFRTHPREFDRTIVLAHRQRLPRAEVASVSRGERPRWWRRWLRR